MTKITTLELINKVAQAIYDKNGLNIYAVDVRGISTMTDYYVIAEGTVDRHVKALSEAVGAVIDEFGDLELLQREGQREGDWMVLDFGEIVVHLLIPDLRERYALEELWSEGEIIKLDFKTCMKPESSGIKG